MGSLMTTEIFARCAENAESQIQLMRDVAESIFKDRTDIIIGVNGSVARREYTSGSDIDHFFLSTVCDNCNQINVSDDEKAFREALEKRDLKMPASGGVFEGALYQGQLLYPIGGDADTNKTLTRRMLFLLEGEWIFNKDGFENLREKLIAGYISDSLENEKLALYLLNDIIRYWRTICIDFEYKTSDGKKSRALRLAKLRMSRMLLCFAGMVAVAEADDMPPDKKRKRLVELFSQQGIDRLDGILSDKFASAKLLYGNFLTKLDDPEFRAKLDITGDDGMQTSEFNDMTELAREFKSELVNILLMHYTGCSKIVQAMLL